MEGDLTYKESYKYIEKYARQNTTDKLTIDYTKLDAKTASLLRITISRTLGQRKREIWNDVLSGAK